MLRSYNKCLAIPAIRLTRLGVVGCFLQWFKSKEGPENLKEYFYQIWSIISQKIRLDSIWHARMVENMVLVHVAVFFASESLLSALNVCRKLRWQIDFRYASVGDGPRMSIVARFCVLDSGNECNFCWRLVLAVSNARHSHCWTFLYIKFGTCGH